MAGGNLAQMVEYIGGRLTWTILKKRVNELTESGKQSSQQNEKPQAKHRMQIQIIKQMIDLASKHEPTHFLLKRIMYKNKRSSAT